MTTRRSQKGAVLRLPEIMDVKAAAPLMNDLLPLRGRAVTLDAADVQKVGGLCLQVLLSARATWAADKIPLTVAAPSTAFLETMALFGATPFAT